MLNFDLTSSSKMLIIDTSNPIRSSNADIDVDGANIAWFPRLQNGVSNEY